MADKYYRLVSFLVNICPQPLRELFLKYMNADLSRPPTCTTLSAYIVFRKPDIYLMKSRKVIRQDQWDLLYPTTGCVDVSTWDITFITLLIDGLFKFRLQKIEEDAIQKIRIIRNLLQHMAETSIGDADFDQMWTDLESATVDLAKQINPSPVYENTIKDYIAETKINNMPKLGDTLRYWYECIIVQLKSEIEDMNERLGDISKTTATCNTNTSECRTILRESSVQKVGPSGDKVMRMKTVDEILKKLNHFFTTTLHFDLPTDFEHPSEVSDIKSKLRDTHHVVVTGYRGSRYLETALAAVKDMDYNHNRCVEMRESSDWRHIDPEEVDLVLCKEPFGDFTYDEMKVKSMADIFNNILRTSTSSDGSKHLDIVIVCELDILNQVTTVQEHVLLQEVVQVYQPTSESEPADLTMITNKESEGLTYSSTQNLLDFTKVFVERKKDETLHSGATVHNAKSKLKMHKAIVITGPRHCGKTTLAISLAAAYDPNQFLILNKPDDIKHVRMNNICLVLLEDFAGKYRYDKVNACAWLQEFDMIHSVVCGRKLNVIITCEEKWLNKCRDELADHPILANIVRLERRKRDVKQEVIDETGTRNEEDMLTDASNQTPNLKGNGQSTLSFTTVVKTETQRITFAKIEESEHIDVEKRAFCQHPDGSFLFTVSSFDYAFESDSESDSESKWNLMHYNSKLEFISSYDIGRLPSVFLDDLYDMCCTGTGDVVISCFEMQEVSLYRISNGTCQFIKTANIEGSIHRVCTCMNKIYAVCSDSSVYVMDSELEVKKIIKLYNHDDEWEEWYERIVPVVVCVKKKFFYFEKHYSNQWTLICDTPEQKQLKYMNIEDFRPRSMCAAGDDSIFVLGEQGDGDTRILQVNTEMQILSDIVLKGKTYAAYLHVCFEMVFDRTNGRLIIVTEDNSLEQIYLK